MKRLAVLMAVMMVGAASFANNETINVKSQTAIELKADNNDFVGEYQFAETSPIKNLKVEASGAGLVGKTETGESELTPSDNKDTFSLKDYDGTLQFKRDASGAVTGVVLTVQGSAFEGTKK